MFFTPLSNICYTIDRQEISAAVKQHICSRPVKARPQKDKRHPTQNRVPHFVMQSFPEWAFPKGASGRDAPGGSGSSCQIDSQKGTGYNLWAQGWLPLLFPQCWRSPHWPLPRQAYHWTASSFCRQYRQKRCVLLFCSTHPWEAEIILSDIFSQCRLC